MSDRSKIEWTESTWNPVTGCTKVSSGCDRCYAETFAERWRGIPGHPYEQGFELRFWPERLEQPLRWRRPRVIFVNSMSDLFHQHVPASYVGKVLDTIRATPRHSYQVLTKRPGKMASVMRSLQPEPLPNLWLGTSVEDDDYVGRCRLLARHSRRRQVSVVGTIAGSAALTQPRRHRLGNRRRRVRPRSPADRGRVGTRPA